MDITRRDLDRIVVSITCTDCPEGARCDRCQSLIGMAVAATLAEGISPRHIHVGSAS